MSSRRRTFRLAAWEEYSEAIAWYEAQYEAQEPGLGKAFAEEVKAALRRAQETPELFSRSVGSARRIRLKRFRAFSIHFAVSQGRFTVLAVWHAARSPAALGRRLR